MLEILKFVLKDPFTIIGTVILIMTPFMGIRLCLGTFFGAKSDDDEIARKIIEDEIDYDE